MAPQIGFQRFSQIAAAAVLTLGVIAPCARAQDTPNVHNMLVFGERSVFFSHLPMFGGLNQAGTGYASPHRYQVILEAALSDEQLGRYQKDRKAHPAVPFYTLNPEEFVLTQLFAPGTGPKMGSFTAAVFRGHLEKEGSAKVPGLEAAQIKIERVVHGRKFDPAKAKPDALEYLLVGRGSERFLAHAIFAPPDFDQVLSIASISPDLTDDDLRQDIRVTVLGRQNAVTARLRKGDSVRALFTVGSQATASRRLEVGPEIYFEEGELLIRPTFSPTAEEEKQ